MDIHTVHIYTSSRYIQYHVRKRERQHKLRSVQILRSILLKGFMVVPSCLNYLFDGKQVIAVINFLQKKKKKNNKHTHTQTFRILFYLFFFGLLLTKSLASSLFHFYPQTDPVRCYVILRSSMTSGFFIYIYIYIEFIIIITFEEGEELVSSQPQREHCVYFVKCLPRLLEFSIILHNYHVISNFMICTQLFQHPSNCLILRNIAKGVMIFFVVTSY